MRNAAHDKRKSTKGHGSSNRSTVALAATLHTKEKPPREKATEKGGRCQQRRGERGGQRASCYAQNRDPPEGTNNVPTGRSSPPPGTTLDARRTQNPTHWRSHAAANVAACMDAEMPASTTANNSRCKSCTACTATAKRWSDDTTLVKSRLLRTATTSSRSWPLAKSKPMKCRDTTWRTHFAWKKHHAETPEQRWQRSATLQAQRPPAVVAPHHDADGEKEGSRLVQVALEP